MTDSEIIAELTRRNLALEASNTRMNVAIEALAELKDEYERACRGIKGVLDYQGHHGNLPSIVKDRLGK